MTIVKLLPKLACRYTRRRFDAYRKRELTVRERRYIVSHLASCPECKPKYAENNLALADLERELQAFGRVSRPQLARMWGAIQQDLQTPRYQPTSYARYGMVATLMVTFVAVSLLSGSATVPALPIANTMSIRVAVASPTPSAAASTFADIDLASSLTPTAKQTVHLQNTPESSQDER